MRIGNFARFYSQWHFQWACLLKVRLELVDLMVKGSGLCMSPGLSNVAPTEDGSFLFRTISAQWLGLFNKVFQYFTVRFST